MSKTEALFMNDSHNIVSQDKATWKVIHKYDDEGELVEEVWVDLKGD